MTRAPLFPIILAVACGGGLAPPAEAPPVGPEVPPPGTGAPATSGQTNKGVLPDVASKLTRGSCEDGPGNEGADSHFVGDFGVNGDKVQGSERWVLYANEKWKAKGGLDCEITWATVGFKVPVGACTDCDTGVKFTAKARPADSKCPEDLVKREAKDFEQSYDLKFLSDGSAMVYFSASGKLLGQGFHQDADGKPCSPGQDCKLNYATSHQCKWF